MKNDREKGEIDDDSDGINTFRLMVGTRHAAATSSPR